MLLCSVWPSGHLELLCLGACSFSCFCWPRGMTGVDKKGQQVGNCQGGGSSQCRKERICKATAFPRKLTELRNKQLSYTSEMQSWYSFFSVSLHCKISQSLTGCFSLPFIYHRGKYETVELTNSELWPGAVTEFVISGFCQLLWPSVFMVSQVVQFEKPKVGVHFILKFHQKFIQAGERWDLSMESLQVYLNSLGIGRSGLFQLLAFTHAASWRSGCSSVCIQMKWSLWRVGSW